MNTNLASQTAHSMSLSPGPKVSLVGMYFRPPAALVLKGLLGGSHLTLRPEPSNPYDENAISVWCNPADMEHEYTQSDELANALEGMGHTIEELMEEPTIMLGYVAKVQTEVVRCHFGEVYNEEATLGGVLTWGSDGKPFIELDNSGDK